MKKNLLIALAGFAGLYLVLLIPISDDVRLVDLPGSEAKAFAWEQDSVWYDLEGAFVEARKHGCMAVRDAIENELVDLDLTVNTMIAGAISPEDESLEVLEEQFFALSPKIPACPEYAEEFLWRMVRIRQTVKELSASWDMNDRIVRARMYRLLYGGRAALEEILLQLPEGSLPAAILAYEEPSVTPSTTIMDVTIHSGDILVSRGGAPTSALIARGNDFPGNFSHVALVHVDGKTNRPTILESHIEKGVTRSTMEEYLADTKLRIMVLRLRSDLPELIRDPLLPHKASTYALEDALKRHIPYDFAMDYSDPGKLFCSEVASAAYSSFGIRLWMGMSTISSPGLRSWLAAFGVRHFVTQEPSDLEYDPQLRVVAEWRDPETLYKDHIDNAVTEVMLEGAERGDELVVDVWMLPVARTLKAYSWVLNVFGAVGPIPEGMDASAALKNKYYSETHDAIGKAVSLRADKFFIEKSYRAPYWRLVEMARDAMQERMAEHH